MRRGDTLEALLASRGVGSEELRPWLAAAESVYDLRTLRPRRGLTFRFDRETRALEAIRYEIDRRSLLVLEAVGDRIEARREGLPYVVEVKGVAGRIERGLREDAVGAGVPERVVAQLADVLGWELDVDGGLAAGDEFRVLYENLWEVGLGRAEAGNVLGATIVSRGRAITAVYFEDADGRSGYFRPTGEALSRTFLRYPVEFTEITSTFSASRPHPILHRHRPHRGIDLAAPRGTPVRAVSGGRVVFSGWAGGLGRAVRVEHPNGLVSSYGHLDRVAPGVRVDGTVERGQIVGWVGATGLATGPHLHFEIEADGVHVDPMTITAAPEAPVPVPVRRAFERVQAEVTRKLAALRPADNPTTVTLSYLAADPAVATE